MIKALIVDDEPLVRKGLIFVLPWTKYGIKVVGEANSGRKALDFIQKNKVDLVFTDISMPEMDGFELMKELARNYQDISIVVLTCYQEFNFVQDAIRLGAIDYILKTQLENDKMDEVFTSITKRLHAKHQTDNLDNIKCGLLYISLKRNTESVVHELLKLHPNLPVADNVWFIPNYSDDEWVIEKIHQDEQYITVKVYNLEGYSWENIYKLLNNYIEHHLFYEYNAKTKIYEWYNDPSQMTPSFDLQEFISQWSSNEWMFDDDVYIQLISVIEKMRPLPSDLRKSFIHSMMKWAEEFNINDHMYYWLSSFDEFHSWNDWRSWLDEVRGMIKEQYNNSQYPKEIVIGIYRALDYIRTQDHLDFTQEKIAEVACMSRGYFSRYFKKIVGCNFAEYVKNLRIEKAKLFLVTTNLPIYEIAEKTGFKDERYFSRVFQKNVHALPSEYRKKGKSE